MKKTVAIAGPLPLMLLFALPQLHAQAKSNSQACDEPSYFGICDPYVPGTFISGEDKQPVRVLSTWSKGPAEKAGICPGDQIVAINGVSALENTFERMLKEIVSASPSPVLLTIKRGDQPLEFKVPRVRESTLIARTHRKWMLMPVSGRLLEVPCGETEDELTQLESFQERIAREEGFKWVKGVPFHVPLAASEDEVRRLAKLESETPSRVTAWTGLAMGRCAPGFIAIGLKAPSQVLIARVIPSSPANHAGLLPGDELLAVDDRPVAGLASAELKKVIFSPDQPRPMNLRLRRNGSEISTKLTTELVDEFEKRNSENPIPTERKLSPETYLLGISALYGNNPREAVIDEVGYPSAAFRAGLHPGDSIISVNGKPIEQIGREELGKLLLPADGSEMRLAISRLGRTLTFQVKPETYETTLAEIGRRFTNRGPVPVSCP